MPWLDKGFQDMNFVKSLFQGRKCVCSVISVDHVMSAIDGQKNKQVDGQIWQVNLDRTERVEYIDIMILHLSSTQTAFHKSYMYVRSLNALDAWDLIQRANRQAYTQQWKHIQITTNKQTT